MIHDDFLLQIWLRRLAGRNLQVTGTACLVFLRDPEQVKKLMEKMDRATEVSWI